MSLISDNIAAFIHEMLANQDSVELKRNELAQYFGCAPSQINYVLSTRFSIEQGYFTSSKRGGGGYILIVRMKPNEMDVLDIINEQIGQEISEAKAKAIIRNLGHQAFITQREADIMEMAVSQLPMIPAQLRNYVRANLLKKMICVISNGQSCHEEDEGS